MISIIELKMNDGMGAGVLEGLLEIYLAGPLVAFRTGL